MRDQRASGMMAKKLIDRVEAPPVTDAIGFTPVEAACARPIGAAPVSASAVGEGEEEGVSKREWEGWPVGPVRLVVVFADDQAVVVDDWCVMVELCKVMSSSHVDSSVMEVVVVVVVGCSEIVVVVVLLLSLLLGASELAVGDAEVAAALDW